MLVDFCMDIITVSHSTKIFLIFVNTSMPKLQQFGTVNMTNKINFQIYMVTLDCN